MCDLEANKKLWILGESEGIGATRRQLGKPGNGEQMRGIMTGLGSVSGLPSTVGFMSMLSRNFARLPMTQ